MHLDEDDSRSSSRVREQGNFRLVSQLHVAIQTPWSRCLSPRAGWTVVHQRVAPFWLDLRLRLRLGLCLYLNVKNRQIGTLAAKCVDFLSTRTGRLFCLNRSHLFCELDLGLVGLAGSFLLVEQLLKPIPSSNCFLKKSSEAVEVIQKLSGIWLLQFPSEQLSEYNKLGVCFVKNDCIRSRLIEL